MRIRKPKIATLALLATAFVLLMPGVNALPPAAVDTPFLQSGYLWSQATDPDLAGYGDWGMYKSWLGLSRLGAESDSGDWSTWAGTTEAMYNSHWGDQQTRHGVTALPDILLGIGSMPYDPVQSDSWDQKLAWEGKTWQLEADNDPATMQHFVNLGNNLVDWHYKSVIIRMDYEFDGGWDPYGSLGRMPNMPGNFIKAWRNIVTTVRKTVHDRDPSIKVKFLWNPTDKNVGVTSADYYPGDAYVDYIGFDSYDSDDNGVYQSGVQPDAATQQAAWTNFIGKRVQWFADFASAANASPSNPKSRNGYVAGRSVPLIAGEWGLWQVAPGGPGAGGDDPTYIKNMYDWMTTHNVYMECYFETPSDGVSTLWPGGYPAPGSGNHSWGTQGTHYPNAANEYRLLFGHAAPPSAPPKPTSLAAFGNAGKVYLRWNASVGIPSATYSVYRGTTPGGESATPIKTGLLTTSYVSAGLGSGTTYYYTVKAVNRAGASAASSEASAVAAVPTNYLTNGTFETGNRVGWSLWAGNNPWASYVEKPAAGMTHSGGYQYAQWSKYNYTLTLYQAVDSATSGLTNGTHVVSAWVKSSGGQYTCQMQVTAVGADGKPHETDVPILAGSAWTRISTPVTVTNGTMSVGFYSNAAGNQWINVDDVVVK